VDADAGPAGTWVLAASDPDLDLPDDARVDLTLSVEDGSWWAGGTAACNLYAGPVELDDGTWAAGDGWAITRRACPPPLMAAERDVLAALIQVRRWALRPPDALVLSGDDVELVFVAATPDRDT
jgi:heat shock protein HslJ